MHKRHLTASALLASALFLTGCGGGSSSDQTVNSAGSSASSSAETDKGNDADVAFLTGMKPHHEQAVEMSDMILGANPPTAVAAIAQQIKGAQDPEITQMTTMLSDLGVKSDAGGHSTGSGMDMGMAGHEGMMSDAMMSTLDAATGTEAAGLYLEGMVRHHQGAIKASDTEIADGQYAPAIALAQKIKTAQQAEITEMQALIESL